MYGPLKFGQIITTLNSVNTQSRLLRSTQLYGHGVFRVLTQSPVRPQSEPDNPRSGVSNDLVWRFRYPVTVSLGFKLELRWVIEWDSRTSVSEFVVKDNDLSVYPVYEFILPDKVL